VRRRYDGERRNPWDEAECGHHYARAMASWSGLLALSGFRYNGQKSSISIFSKTTMANFKSFWSNATAWGTFTITPDRALLLQVDAGQITIQSIAFPSKAARWHVMANDYPLTFESADGVFHFREPIQLKEGGKLLIRAT